MINNENWKINRLFEMQSCFNVYKNSLIYVWFIFIWNQLTEIYPNKFPKAQVRAPIFQQNISKSSGNIWW